MPLPADVFPDPGVIGQSEYRAIYECLDGVEPEDFKDDDEYLAMLDAMLDEFAVWARRLQVELRQRRG